MEHNNDRRKEQRHEIDWPVFLRTGNKMQQIGDVADISLSGIKVVLNNAVEIKNSEGKYDLYLCNIQSPSDLMNISGQAVWSAESDHTITIGLELEKMDGTTKEMLKGYIDHSDDLALQMDLEI